MAGCSWVVVRGCWSCSSCNPPAKDRMPAADFCYAALGVSRLQI